MVRPAGPPYLTCEARHLPGVQVDAGQLGIVIEHFLKVRHQPTRIHRVAMEPPTQLIIHAAVGHLVEGKSRGIEKLSVFRSRVLPQQ